MQEQVDEFTGVSSKVIIESKDPSLRPSISVRSVGWGSRRLGFTPSGRSIPLGCTEGEEVGAGQVVAKIPREASKTKDITGGLAACGGAVRSP